MKKNDGVSYKRLVLDDSYQTVSEWLADKNEDVHNLLLDAALKESARKCSWIESLDDWEIIEHRRKSFLEVPKCLLRRKKWPFDTHMIDISEFWDPSFFNYTNYNPSMTINDNTVYDEEVDSINYVTGIAKSMSRLEGTVREITLSSLNKGTKINKKDIEDTFTYKAINQ